jgi:hypothetical protein
MKFEAARWCPKASGGAACQLSPAVDTLIEIGVLEPELVSVAEPVTVAIGGQVPETRRSACRGFFV